MMDTGKQLTSFLKAASKNKRFHQSHLSLYSAILMCYTKGLCQNPFRISRRELMMHSAIHSFATYHKCMKDLVVHGYVEYQPSYHPHLASQVTLLNDNENHEG
jgi:hypothetical protein